MAAEDRFPDLTRHHRATWHGFVTFMKISLAISIVMLVILALFAV